MQQNPIKYVWGKRLLLKHFLQNLWVKLKPLRLLLSLDWPNYVCLFVTLGLYRIMQQNPDYMGICTFVIILISYQAGGLYVFNLQKLVESAEEVKPDAKVVFYVYGHDSEGKGKIIEVEAVSSSEAIRMARELNPSSKFSHANLK